MKISLGTFIVSIIAIILVAVVIMGIYISNQNKVLEESKVAINNNQVVKESDEIQKNSNQVTTNNVKSSSDSIYANGYLDVDKINEKYKETLNSTNLGEIAEAIGLPYLYDLGNSTSIWLSNDEILGSLMREGKVSRNTIPNELICRMGFNLLNTKELSAEIDNTINELTIKYGWENIPRGYIKSLDGKEDLDYTGPVASIVFSDNKLKNYINNIFGSISYNKEIIEKLPTYKYTFKKDDVSGNYYFYSFEKID